MFFSSLRVTFLLLSLTVLINYTRADCADGQNYTSVCYPDLECFDDCPPFEFLPTPISPERINTTFLLYTEEGQTEPEIITEDYFGSFNPEVMTRFIAHGFQSRGTDPWFQNMKDELLINQDDGPCNVVVVDWSEGAKVDWDRPTELVPSANSRVVARQIRNLIRAFRAQTDFRNDQVHCIGHSLGAQLCGFLGQEFQEDRIGRISGLDPAGLVFDTADPDARLSPGDALFVDVIHTDTEGPTHSGTNINVGLVDFWPNKGTDQPGCFGSNVCSHLRVNALFTESVNGNNEGCLFMSDTCDSLEDMKEDLCSVCSTFTCQAMGFHSTKYLGRGIYSLETNDRSPFCFQ